MTVNTQYYAPDFVIKIGGVEFHHGMVSDVPDQAGNLDVLSVTVTESANQSDSFEFKVRGRLAQLEKFPRGKELMWIDDERFAEKKEVEIDMGYVNNRTLKFVGEITALAVSFSENGVPTLSVQGQSLYNKLHRNKRVKPFATKRDGDIVREIAEACGLEAKVDETNIEYPTASYVGASFYKILQDRAERLDYEVAVKERTLYFQKPRYKVDQSPKLRLVWGENLLGFNARLKTTNMPTRINARGTVSGQGGGTEAITATTNASESPAYLAVQSGPQRVLTCWGESFELLSDHRITTQEEARTMTRAKLERAALDYNQGNGTAIGDPKLVSRQVVEIDMIGKRLSGNYYVTSTTHTIDASGYRTTFQVKRDGQ